MFIDEIKSKLNLGDKIFPYVLTVLGDGNLYVGGVKSALSVGEECIRLRLSMKVCEIVGEGLALAEIGGGDVFIRGKVTNVNFN